jgi:hypothetical protein
MANSLVEIENDALCLPEEDRARLAVSLLTSLEESLESCESSDLTERLWLEEADRRVNELASGVVQGVPAVDVFARIRAKLAS